jgi:hypothetical protein
MLAGYSWHQRSEVAAANARATVAHTEAIKAKADLAAVQAAAAEAEKSAAIKQGLLDAATKALQLAIASPGSGPVALDPFWSIYDAALAQGWPSQGFLFREELTPKQEAALTRLDYFYPSDRAGDPWQHVALQSEIKPNGSRVFYYTLDSTEDWGGTWASHVPFNTPEARAYNPGPREVWNLIKKWMPNALDERSPSNARNHFPNGATAALLSSGSINLPNQPEGKRWTESVGQARQVSLAYQLTHPTG